MDKVQYSKNEIVINNEPDMVHIKEFAPKPDITAYELACLIPLLITNRNEVTKEFFDSLGTATRHLKAFLVNQEIRLT